MSRRDIWGILAVLGATVALLAFRHFYVEPREWAVTCLAAAPPLACLPRGVLLTLQHHQIWGASALVLGLAAFFGAPHAISVAGVALGAAGVMNYNATWGMLGLALAAWAWVRTSAGSATAGAGPVPPTARQPCSR